MSTTEVPNVSQRTRAALAAKRARGERLGAPPLGFRSSGPGKGLEIDEDEILAVALIFEMGREGASFRPIAAALEAEGHRTKRGGRWDPRTVKGVCDRRFEISELWETCRTTSRCE